MARDTFIFGNGLGRALNNNYFKLSSGLEYVWDNSQTFSDADKKLVISALDGVTEQEYPESEEQLGQLQLAIIASNFLGSLEHDDVEWLNDNSRKIPSVFNKFVHEVGCYFHNSGESLPESFINSLADHVRETSSHVAVLNYDNLLYDGLYKKGLLRGYDDTLNDGFRRDGFSPDYLDRFRQSRQAWYMHLHGSPLFIGDKKLMRDERDDIQPNEKSQIVLTHVKHKPMLISSSKILSEYWRRLSIAIGESGRVILFGYSGCDEHLNEIVKEKAGEKEVIVVSRKTEDGGENTLREYWENVFENCNVNLRAFEDVLSVECWSEL